MRALPVWHRIGPLRKNSPATRCDLDTTCVGPLSQDLFARGYKHQLDKMTWTYARKLQLSDRELHLGQEKGHNATGDYCGNTGCHHNHAN